jgi:hypothetical protein
VALLCDYFIAPSDDAAAATIDRVGAPDVASTADGPACPTVAGNGIEPVVQVLASFLRPLAGLARQVRDGEQLYCWMAV